jgi:MinD-like ATPase involved in chromosome partitioning or flagellar assembly
MGEIIGIISIKGGVGKTTTAVNLASIFSHHYKKKVLLVDGNLSAPNVGLHLGIANPEKSIHDVLGDKILAKEAIHSHAYGFDVLPGSLIIRKVDPMKIRTKLKGIAKKYDIVIVDSSPTINQELLGVMLASDKLFVITTPDPITVNMTAHATKMAKEKGTPILGVILNKVKNKKYESKIEHIEKKAKAPVIAKIRDNLKILESLASVTPVVISYPHSKITREFRALAAAMIDEKYIEPSLWEKFKNHVREDYTNLKNHKFSKRLKYYG